MLRACLLEFRGQWDEFLLLGEIAYYNSCHNNIQMALFKALYGRGYCTLIWWFESLELSLYSIDLLKDNLARV